MSNTKEITMYEILKEDLCAIKVRHCGRLWMLAYAVTIPGFLAVTLVRFSCHFSTKKGWLKGIAIFFWRLNVLLNGCDIEPRANIGAGLYMPHPMGIVIGNAVIGRNATILHNVTLGIRQQGVPLEKENYPCLGDNVTVSTGAVLLGGIKIGDHAVIAANAVVLNDVPADTTAVGVPARIIKN